MEDDSDPRDIRPIPDPTRLTNQLVFREMSAIREVLETKVSALAKEISAARDLIDCRIIATSHAIDVLQREIDASPAAIQAAVERLKELHDMQFAERDMRALTSTNDAKTALSAALQAQKEAFNEQKQASTKQIDQMVTLISATNDGLRASIDDIKGRLTLLEGAGKGSKDLSSMIFTLVGLGVAAVAAIIAFMKMS